ncbi:hypothetical protein, partial [Paracidovorax anthurii]|uniref:hypothetical protein n=1 Tax=Paracidovorax anthurii TaxID=78229 RepID=UPI0039EF417D
ALAGPLDGVAQAQAALLHARIVSASGLRTHIPMGFVQRIPSLQARRKQADGMLRSTDVLGQRRRRCFCR